MPAVLAPSLWPTDWGRKAMGFDCSLWILSIVLSLSRDGNALNVI